MPTTLFSAPPFTPIRLGLPDLARLQQLFEACEDYSRLVTGEPAVPEEAEREFANLPPGKSLEDKFLLGLVREDETLGGVLDLVRDYPEPGTWYLGLLLLHPSERGKRRGEALHGAMLGWVKEQGGQRLRLGVVEQNEGARKFWSRMGYREIDRKPFQAGKKTSTALVMERSV